MDWNKEIAAAREAARVASKVLKEGFGKVRRIEKKGEIDLITEVDLKAEKTIIEILTRHFPEDTILAEETGMHHCATDRVWVVDPLDGTTNYAHSFPFFAVSIALEVQGEIVVGMVFDPLRNEYFEAAKGMGAFSSQGSIKVSRIGAIGSALMGTGFPYTVHQDSVGILDRLKKILGVAQGIRRAGAASLDLCYVASGCLDGFWEEGLKPWDTAAGSIIIQEAGGRLTDFSGDEYSPYKGTIVASNGLIHHEILEVLGTIK